ncbi:hypothetical protein CathTA2_1478 [Caldalkalibacillus thermarum TA2.A1]|uniref:Iron-sulfur cluster biosynthesis family protein n=1 Tax=Caldalkalibacillus thermarum (strain TA2.A1) TaxID=986075 RepID=F5L6M8_CALTT|nr:hypothetical protein CathTA2_1478 [Caldalkalibacillus thermarum TA2.A1]QZT34577.1 iron-sulfur cluster biosynthesis family protein [Caldalkalibacillus thermarum TA2.A1]
MELHVTEAALAELQDYTIPEGKGLRIDAEITGG